MIRKDKNKSTSLRAFSVISKITLRFQDGLVTCTFKTNMTKYTTAASVSKEIFSKFLEL